MRSSDFGGARRRRAPRINAGLLGLLLLLSLLSATPPAEAAFGFAHGAIQWLAADIVGTTYTVSGLAFQPSAIRVYWTGIGSAVNATTTTVNERRGVGFATSTTDRRAVATESQDAAATAVTTTGYRTDCIAFTVTSTPAVDGILDVNSITADGFTFIVDDQGVVDITIFWEAWGGSDITVATTLEIAEPAATGDVDYTVTGFGAADADDQVVMFAGVQETGAAQAVSRNDSGLMIGFATGGASTENVVALGNSDDASDPTETHRYGLSGESLAMIFVAGGNPNARAQLTQFNLNGFRLNWIARGVTGRKYIALAMKGGHWQAGATSLAVGTLNATTTVSSLPFTPLGMSLIGAGAIVASTAGTSVNHDVLWLGSGSSTASRRAQTVFDENGLATTGVQLGVRYDAILVNVNAGVDMLVDIDAMLTAGWRLIVDDASSVVVNAYIGYLTFGQDSVVCLPIRLLMRVGC